MDAKKILMSGANLNDYATDELEQMLLEEDGKYVIDTIPSMIDKRMDSIDSKIAKQYKGRERPDEYKEMRDSQLMSRDKISFYFSRALSIYAVMFTVAGLFITESVFFWYGFSLIVETIYSETFTNIIVIIMSLIVVLTYFVLTWTELTLQAKYGKPATHVFSLRAVFDRAKYFFGFGERVAVEYREIDRNGAIEKVPVYQSNSFIYKEVDSNPARLAGIVRDTLFWAIAIVSVYSRLHGLIVTLPTEAVGDLSLVATQARYFQYNFGFEQAVVIVIVFLITWAIFKSSHYSLEYIHSVYHRAVGEVDVDFFDPSAMREAKRAEVEKLQRLFMIHRLTTIRNKLKEETPVMEFGTEADTETVMEANSGQSKMSKSNERSELTESGRQRFILDEFTPHQTAYIRGQQGQSDES